MNNQISNKHQNQVKDILENNGFKVHEELYFKVEQMLTALLTMSDNVNLLRNYKNQYLFLLKEVKTTDDKHSMMQQINEIDNQIDKVKKIFFEARKQYLTEYQSYPQQEQNDEDVIRNKYHEVIMKQFEETENSLNFVIK